MEKQAKDIVVGKELFVELPDCGHTFDVGFLDQFMDKTVKDNEHVTLPKCPSCKKKIQKCTRYGTIVNGILRKLNIILSEK